MYRQLLVRNFRKKIIFIINIPNEQTNAQNKQTNDEEALQDNVQTQSYEMLTRQELITDRSTWFGRYANICLFELTRRFYYCTMYLIYLCLVIIVQNFTFLIPQMYCLQSIKTKVGHGIIIQTWLRVTLPSVQARDRSSSKHY